MSVTDPKVIYNERERGRGRERDEFTSMIKII